MNNNATNPGSTFRQRLIKFAYPLYLSIAQRIRTNHMLIRLLFKVRLPKKSNVSWDFTTLVLKHTLKKHLSEDSKILEIGVGQAALLSIFLAKHYNISPDGIDIIPERVKNARLIAQLNNVSLNIRQSDFFENITNTYQLIFWNAAYIPTPFGEDHSLTQHAKLNDNRAWDGGNNGTEAITRFLTQAPDYLTPNGEILLGVNNFYVPENVMSNTVDASSFIITKRISKPLNPSAVYVLHHRRIENES
ncbi:MAG: methyltransferase [bacterium]|nr:methyltransferase [bacterium]